MHTPKYSVSTTCSNIFWILKIRKRKLHIALEVININSRSYCLFLENTLISADLLYNLNLHLHDFPMIKIVYDHRHFFFNSGENNKERRKKNSSTENLKKVTTNSLVCLLLVFSHSCNSYNLGLDIIFCHCIFH